MEEVLSTGLEKIIKNINDVISETLNVHESEYDMDPFDVENLIECKNLCDKILTYNYFDTSESYIDYLGKINQLKKFKCFNRVLDKWYVLYEKDLKEKRRDLNKLFKLIIELSEEI